MSLADQQWCPTSVQVTVLQARGLRAKGKSGTNDAYALMQVGKEKFQTSVVEKTVAPVWKEEATFDLPPVLQGGGGGPERCMLHVHVQHRALVGPDKQLGQAVINLLQLSEDTARNKTEWFKLVDKTGKADKDRGEVLLDIQFMKNNMTGSMFDLSTAGKSRSRLGKFKDKVRGKKKETEPPVVPSLTQVLTDSEEEEEVANGDAEGKEGKSKDKKSKKLKMKSLFAPKSNLQRNMSQSMSVLPAKNSSLSGSQSSGLNVDTSEGKKKFKFSMHKRSGSSSNKDLLSGNQKQTPAEQSNLCINGSHVYCEEPPPRTTRAGSNFSLTSSGHGSMEDVPENSPPSVDSLEAVKEYSPWMEEAGVEDEDEDQQVKDGVDESNEEEEEKINMEEERRRKEEALRRQEEMARLAEEKLRQEEEERIKVQREEERKREEEQKREEELEKMRQEEEERIKREEEERIQKEKLKQEEEERRKREEEQKLLEQKMKLEEEKRKREELIRMEEEKALEKKRQEEEYRLAEENRLKEESIRREEERAEKERRQQEELMKKQEEEQREERLKKEEMKRHEEEEARREREEYERLEEKRMEEEKIRQEEKKMIEEENRLKEERRKKEEEMLRRQELQRLAEEKLRQEEEERVKAEKAKREEEEEMRREEEERIKKEQIKRDEERRRKEEEEERARKEKEENERKAEEMRLKEEEKRRKEEEERIKEERAERERKEEEARKLEKEIKINEEQRAAEKMSKITKPAEITSNPFDEDFSPPEDIPNSSEPHGLADEDEAVQRCQPAVSSARSGAISTDEKDLIKTQWEKRPAPQPPGRNPSETWRQNEEEEEDASTRHLSGVNKQSKEKDVKTVSVPPQRSVQMIAPLNRSPEDLKNTQSELQNNLTKATKQGKRPAPSRPPPGGDEPPSKPHRVLSETKQVRTPQSLNPFEDDEDELTDDANKDDASQAKIKSSKVARAPAPPTLNEAPSCPLVLQNKDVTGSPGLKVPNKKGDTQPRVKGCVQVQESPNKETEQNKMVAGVKEEAPPLNSRRLLTVKPLNPLEQQQPISLVQEENNKSTGSISTGDQRNAKVEAVITGPYSQLTQEELISLVLKQEKQLSERDKKISELEQYIDNLLVRVIEEQPSILMSLSALK